MSATNVMRKSALNLRLLHTDTVTVQGNEYAIEDKEQGTVYMTNRAYIDKLFKEMGYRNLGVIKTLEEFAGITVSDIGSLKDSSLFVDDTTDSFIISSEQSVESVKLLLDKLDELKYTILSIRKSDNYYYWDQWEICNSNGDHFILYVDLCDEYVQVFSLDIDQNRVIKGAVDEGTYKLNNQDSMLDLFSLLENPPYPSIFTIDQELSVDEIIRLFTILGYVKKRRKSICLTEKGEEISSSDEYLCKILESSIDTYNSSSWLSRHITRTAFTFYEACELISKEVRGVSGGIKFWDVRKFYSDNLTESSDMFVLSECDINKI